MLNKRAAMGMPSPMLTEQSAVGPTLASSHTHSLIEPSGQLEERPASPAVSNSKAMSYTLPNHSVHPLCLYHQNRIFILLVLLIIIQWRQYDCDGNSLCYKKAIWAA